MATSSNQTHEIKQVSETSETEEQPYDFLSEKTIINKIKKDNINLIPSQLSSDLNKKLHFEVNQQTEYFESFKLKPQTFKQPIDYIDDQDDKNICSVCLFNKATIKCKKCGNYPACTNCINNLKSRDISFFSYAYQKDLTHIYKYDPYDIHKVTFNCPLCRSNNYIHLNDPELSKDDLLKLIYKESLEFGRIQEELKQCKKIISGGSYYDYNDEYKTHVDYYQVPGHVVDGYVKNYSLTIDENEQLKIDKSYYKELINIKDREIKALNDEIKALKSERFNLCIQNEINKGYIQGLNEVTDKYKHHIKKSFDKLKSLTPKKRDEFTNIIYNTQFNLSFNFIPNGDDTARIECLSSLI